MSNNTNRPASRRKSYTKWGDVITRYNHMRKWDHPLNGATRHAAFFQDEREKMINPVKYEKDRKETIRASTTINNARKGVRVDKESGMFQQKTPNWNTGTTSPEKAKATADSWKIIPEDKRRTVRLYLTTPTSKKQNTKKTKAQKAAGIKKTDSPAVAHSKAMYTVIKSSRANKKKKGR